VLGPLVEQRGPGKRLFPGITAASALTVLREMLEVLGVQEARSYRTHDLRRGHAKDLQVSGGLSPSPFACCNARSGLVPCAGAPLYEILAAGEWKSPAFLAYIDMHRHVLWPQLVHGVAVLWAGRLETDMVVEAHMNDSESDTEQG